MILRALYFWLQPSDEARAAPELDGVTVDQPPGPLDGLGVIPANQRFESYEMPVAPDGVSSVLCHPHLPATAGLEISRRWEIFDFMHRIIAVSVRIRTQENKC
jgi:hypothetical protein